jgi:ParB family chromosome partitioning protein
MSDRKPALGKGLSALIPDAPDTLSAPRTTIELDIDALAPNDYQPRATLDGDALRELARSVAVHGVIQPIVVRAGEHGRYHIIAGERRWRAAQLAGLRKVPVVIKDIAEGERARRLEMALIENVQRENLNPIEEARAYRRLVDEFALRQEDIADQVGKDRSSVANALRLLRLPDEVQIEVASGRLSMGHARAIVSLASDAEQRRVAREVVSRGLSVRETESLVKKAVTPQPATARPAAVKDVHTRAAEEQLRLAIGTGVEIRRRGKGGTVAIAFANEDELQRIYEYLTERP